MQQIPQMLALINNLQEEIRDLKAKCSMLIDSRDSSRKPSNIMFGEDISNEVYERNKRSRNIIIYGSHESGTAKQDQINSQLDNVIVQNLMGEVGIQCEQIKPIRLGRFEPTKEQRLRPIRITLSSPDDVHKTPRKFKTIRNYSRHCHLSISLDRIPKRLLFLNL